MPDLSVMACPKKRTRLRRKNSGFTLVEVLVATLIMVMSIVTVTAAIRQFAIHREKLVFYEKLYTTTLSLRDRIMNDTLKEDTKESGTLNGLAYSYACRMVESANNYVVSEEAAQSGNKGIFTITLFKVSLLVEGKHAEFYKTQYQRRFESSTDEF